MIFGLSFYGVMALLTRFFLEDLHYNEADTMMIVGAFSSIGPLFAIAGGFICDKFLGSYRSLTLAFGCYTVGYGLLVAGAGANSVPLSMCGIALASYARGLQSPSYPSLYRRTFERPEDFENVYAINYSVNNIGAFLGQYLFPLFVIGLGFAGSFSLSCGLAAIGFVILIVSHKGLVNQGTEIDQNPVSKTNWIAFLIVSIAMITLVFFMFSNMDIGQIIVYIIGAAAIAYFIYLMVKSDRAEKLRMGTILIMTFLTTCFFIYYGQMMTSMNMVAINTMRGDLFGLIPIAPEASMSFNPLWCIVAGPVIAFTFTKLESKGINLSTATKISISFVLTAVAFGILTYAAQSVGSDLVIRPEVFLLIHFFQAFAEVIVGSLVVAFILQVTPKRIEGFSVSMFSVAMALSGIIGAVLSTSIAIKDGQTLNQAMITDVYGGFFGTLTIAAVGMVAVALGCSWLIKKMLNNAEAEDAKA